MHERKRGERGMRQSKVPDGHLEDLKVTKGLNDLSNTEVEYHIQKNPDTETIPVEQRQGPNQR